MTSGILSQVAPVASTATTAYVVPANVLSSFTISIVNRHATAAAKTRIAISTTDSPSDAEWIEYNLDIPAGFVFERTGLLAQAGRRVVIFSDSASLSVTVAGYEDVA